VDAGFEVAVAGATAAAAGGRGIDWVFVAGAVIAAGIVVRLVWLAASLLSLRRMRAIGQVAPATDAHDELQRRLGTRAEIRYVDGLRQPVTFGALRPVVLLPASLRDHPDAIQQAVVCHELFHVQRRDWLWVLGEETVRAALWFNPAVWWLIARVQLAREELVDELTVLATNRRRAYMEALLAFADESPLAPAAAFARRRHLFRRMVLLSKEGVMSSKRIAASCVVAAVVMLAGSWYAVSAFPLTRDAAQATQLLNEPGPLEKQAKAVTAENPVPRRVSHAAAVYPADAEVVGMTGTVNLMITLDQAGRVAEVRRNGITYRSTNPSGNGSFRGTSPRNIDDFFKKAAAAPGMREAFDALHTAAFDAVRQWRYDPPYEGPMSFPVMVPVAPEGSPLAGVNIAQPRGPLVGAESAVRVGGGIKAPTKIRDVRPEYPPIAQAARVSGVVIVEALIGTDGTVEDARILRSIPLLDQAALDAVLQWRFTPTLLNGQAVPVIMTVTVNFRVQ
jgi:TonB family protein